MLCKESGFCEIFNTVVERFCKCLNERTASGGTCFIELYTVNGVILYLDAFHILSADIKDAVDIRVKERSSSIMGDSFNFTFIKKECSLHKCFAVSGRTCSYDMSIVRQLFIHILYRMDSSKKRTSVIAAVI